MEEQIEPGERPERSGLSSGARLRITVVLAIAVAGGCVAAALAATGGHTAATTTTNSMAGMSGMSGMPMPVPMQTLGTATWQGMKIVARATTPLPFVVVSGTTTETIKPTKKDSFHLMVMLSDVHNGVPIPYASVWATIRKAGKIVFDERQWPMISRYMGPHYGNDVALPGKGKYQLTLLISPPQGARHMEYAKVWLKPHRVTMPFTWNGRS